MLTSAILLRRRAEHRATPWAATAARSRELAEDTAKFYRFYRPLNARLSSDEHYQISWKIILLGHVVKCPVLLSGSSPSFERLFLASVIAHVSLASSNGAEKRTVLMLLQVSLHTQSLVFKGSSYPVNFTQITL